LLLQAIERVSIADDDPSLSLPLSSPLPTDEIAKQQLGVPAPPDRLLRLTADLIEVG